jgi:very-short-patch-repair endonuclease
MKSSGLGEMCLELHGRAANRRQVLEDIGLSLSLALDDVPVHEEPKELLLIRDALNGLSKSIHTPLSNAETPFRILSHMSGLRAQSYLAHGLDDKKLSSLSFQEIEDVIEQATGVLEKVKTVGDVYTHPLSFMKVKSRDPYERANMVKQCDIFLSHVEDLRLSWEQAFGTPFVLSESSPDRLDRLVGTLKSRPDEWSKLHSVVATLEGSQEGLSTLSSLSVFLSSKLKASRIWDLEALSDLPLDSWISIVEDASVSLWKRLVGPYRGIKSKLSSASNVPLPDDFDKLVSWMKDGAAYKSSLEKLEPHLLYLNDTVPFWKEDLEDLFEVRSWERKVSSLVPKGMSLSLAFDVSNVSKVERVLEFWTKSQKSSVSAKESWDFSDKAHSVSLSELEVLMSSALEAFEDYSDWSLVMVFLSELDRIGAGSLKASVLAGGSIEEVEGRLIAAWSEGNWRRACEERPDLKDLGSVNRHDLVEGFARRDIDLMKNNKMKIRAVHRGQLPRGAHGEMGILRGEISKKSRHMPLRKLMSVAGTTIQRIKPVFFMSPLSVAQHLSPGDLDFDLLVIDEASQVRPEDALGAIARARQIVVVGDQKQLPPTSFFDKILEEEASSDGLANVTDMESILSLCRARGVSERMLEWHYRSKDPSLMTVSNTEFYREKLILPPAPFKDKDSTGLVLTPVEGLYARKGSHTGRPGTNSIEALAVIDSLEDLHRKHPERSLGVVALSRTQADCILETLEVQARHRPLLASLLRQTGPEALFVKNLETVQGDERDIILISVGYGPVKEGGRLASMNFGPINQEGGERRLNVLFTRSRYRCEVFCSFDPEDIDLKKSETFGVRVLKRFLMFAKEGQLDQRLLTGMGPDSPFEESVADAIHSLGYGVDFQVGSAGFRVDLAVYEHSRPSRYILAVECDGAAYHSAQWARERDRLRQGILEGMGWTFHRVWSTDWFHNKAYEIRRLKSALEKAVKNEKVAPALVAPLVVEDEETSIDPNILRQKVASLSSKPLKEYQVWPCEDVGDDYRGWVSVLRGVIDVEGPVHSDALLKRVQEATNRNRATAKWKESVLSALSELSDEYLSKSDFWMTAEQFTQGPRHRPEFLRFDPVPDFEIKAVCDLLEKESDFSEESEKILVVSKALGVVKSSVSGYFE